MNELLALIAEDTCSAAAGSLLRCVLRGELRSPETIPRANRSSEVQEGLEQLLNHHFLSVTQDKQYSVNVDRLLSCLLVPKYRQVLNTTFPNASVLNELLVAGSIGIDRLMNCQDLITKGILIEYHTMSLPHTPRKKAKTKQTFSLNFDWLDQLILSEAIGKIVCAAVHKEAAVLAEIFYKLTPQQPLTIFDLLEAIPINFSEDKIQSVLEELLAHQFIVKEEDGYRLNKEEIVDRLRSSILQSLVSGRHTSHHARVYKILTKRGQLDQVTVSQLALIGLAEAGRYLEDLIETGFVVRITDGTTEVFGLPPSYSLEELVCQLYLQVAQLKQQEHICTDVNRRRLLGSAISEVVKSLLVLTKL